MMNAHEHIQPAVVVTGKKLTKPAAVAIVTEFVLADIAARQRKENGNEQDANRQKTRRTKAAQVPRLQSASKNTRTVPDVLPRHAPRN
jgi:hypothetical protein